MATNYGQAVSYAGFWARVAAYIIDFVILIILGLMISIGSAFAGEMGMLIGQIVYLLINLLYWPVMESSARQATFGKSIVGIQVTDLNGKRMSFLRALLRNLAKIISAIPLGIGYLLAAFTGRKQALHDMITKSLVVRTGPLHFFKAFAATMVGLVIAVGGSGAYFYYVLLPQMPELQDEIGRAKQEAMKSPVNPTHAMPPVAKALPPAPIPVPAAPQPVSALAIPEPATLPSATVTTAVPEMANKPVPEPVKPASKARKYASKNPKPVTMSEPMDSQSEAPTMSREVAPQVPEVIPQPAPAVVFAPDMESKVIRPKYNDLMTAVLRSDQDAVKQLLDLGWWVDKPGADGFTPLVAAVMNRDVQMVQLLLDRGAVPSSQALKIARDKKDAETASLLEQRGAR